MFAPCSDNNAPPGGAAPGFYARASHQVWPLFEDLQRNAHRQIVSIGTRDAEEEARSREALRERVDLFCAYAPLATGKRQFDGGASRRSDDARHEPVGLSAHGLLHATIANFHGGRVTRKLWLDFEVAPIVKDEARRLLAEAPLDAAAALDDFLREGIDRQSKQRYRKRRCSRQAPRSTMLPSVALRWSKRWRKSTNGTGIERGSPINFDNRR